MLAAQQRPDHATLARFVERHQEAIAGLFGEVLTLCARSGLAKVGVVPRASGAATSSLTDLRTVGGGRVSATSRPAR